MMLAQIDNVPSDTIKNVALIILAVLGAAYYIKEIFFNGPRRDISPQPLAVEIVEELHEQFASKTDFEKFRAESTADRVALREIIRVEIPAMVAAVNSSGEGRIRRVHARLDPLVIGVAQLCAKQGIKMPRTIEDGGES